MKQLRKLWFSVYNLNNTYSGDEKDFIDPSNFEWATELASNVDAIKNELQIYLKNHQLASYFNTSMVSKQNSWKTISLKTWSIEQFKNQKHFPATTAILNKYPQIISSSFNLLTANSQIKPHSGDTNAIYRCHLGIDIPEGLPNCGFRVKKELREWENNKWLIFIDAFDHEAWNNSNRDRYIFVVDVLRDEFRHKKWIVTSTVLTSLFLQKKAETFTFIMKLKQPSITAITKILHVFAYLATSASNVLKVY